MEYEDDIIPLIDKLNRTCRDAFFGARDRANANTNYVLSISHLLTALLDASNTDLHALLRHYDVNTSHFSRDVAYSIDELKRGSTRIPAFEPEVVQLLATGWFKASFDGSKTRSAHLLIALLEDKALARAAREITDELEKIPLALLKKEWRDVTASSVEAQEVGAPGAEQPDTGGAPGKPRAGKGGKTEALDQFTIDLTARAKAGKIDPVIGRESEIRQIIDILTRRRQNNPILTGEAGVGKTAVVEGFAQRIADNDVPPALQNVRLLTLDLGLLQAGAGVRGEFENRLKNVIEEVKSSATPIILFIDEAHTLIGAGNQAGGGDAANLLKPALARGELRTIAATTWAEYKKYFEKDAALARRFQAIKVEEPDEPNAITMMRGIVKTLEKHHSVRILDEAVIESVRLSRRYLSGRQLPDKSFSVLDTACGKVAIGRTTTPAAVEDCHRRIHQLELSIEVLEREAATGADHAARIAELTQERDAAIAEGAALEKRWKQELALVEQALELRQKLESKPSAGEAEQLKAKLKSINDQLGEMQGEDPLMHTCIDGQTVAEVISGWTGIPVGRMVSDEVQTILNLRQKLEERIIGQSHALEQIAQAIRTSRANMTDPRKPIGVFLLVGSSGVGKTETALALAELLYGGEQNVTTINMSEFKEEHKVSLLMGSPPGYIGYGEGGVLTEAVRRKPYSILLLDEMEKAHSGVQDVFYQVFDKGTLRDGEGRDIDFKNTIILMTSNAATDAIVKHCADPDTRPEPDKLKETIYPELLKTFKPAFLGRLNVIPYYPLADDVMRKIIQLQLGRIARRVKDSYKAGFTYAPEVVASIAERCTEVSTGGRNIDHILTRTMLPELSAQFLQRMVDGAPIGAVHVGMGKGGGFEYKIT
jgi:type VI secretion system protein VasG